MSVDAAADFPIPALWHHHDQRGQPSVRVEERPKATVVDRSLNPSSADFVRQDTSPFETFPDARLSQIRTFESHLVGPIP